MTNEFAEYLAGCNHQELVDIIGSSMNLLTQTGQVSELNDFRDLIDNLREGAVQYRVMVALDKKEV